MLGKAYGNMKRARKRRPEERRPKPRPKQRETNDARNAILLLWIQVTIGSQEPIVKRTITVFRATGAMIIMLNITIDCIVIRLKLAERRGPKTFQNQRAEPARGILKMFASSTTSQRLTRMGPRISAGFHWLISAHGRIVLMEY